MAKEVITMVVLVTLEDAGRFLLLMASLAKFVRVSPKPGISILSRPSASRPSTGCK